MRQVERKRLLVTVRTYPTPAHKGVEVSCTAGITDDKQWVRLFPVPYRFMDYDKRFSKYQWLDLEVRKASDARPESYTPNLDSIKIISRVDSNDNWRLRKEIVYPLRSHCLCCLKAERDRHKHPTLGIFRPKAISRLIIEPDESHWTPAQLERLRQLPLFMVTPARELEKIPYRFEYEFRCDHQECSGHTLTCTDWELAESYRSWLRRYGPNAWEAKFRQRFEAEMIQKNDTHFYVGTMHGHPATWIIVGLFYPRK